MDNPIQTERNDQLRSAAEAGITTEIITQLQNGANIEAMDHDGWTALMFACFHNHAPVVELLLQKKANLEHKSHNNCTPLIVACMKGWTEIVKLLVQNNVNIEEKDNEGMTPLMWASYYGHYDIVDLLIQKNANTLATNHLGETAQDIALFKRNDTFYQLFRTLTEQERKNFGSKSIRNIQLYTRFIKWSEENPQKKQDTSDLTLQIPTVIFSEEPKHKSCSDMIIEGFIAAKEGVFNLFNTKRKRENKEENEQNQDGYGNPNKKAKLN